MLEVLKAYPLIPFCSHLRGDLRKIIKRYELSVSPCHPMNVVVDCE